MEQQLIHIQNLIYEVRGKNVMFDFDLAIVYDIETKRLKEAVRRNIERFPDDFMFQLTESEWNELVANCVQLPKNLKHSYIIPSVFTQEGVAMLSGVLRSPVAIQVNIIIMRAFVAFRQLLLAEPDKITKLQIDLAQLKMHIDNINEDTQKQIDIINETLTEMQTPKLLDRPRQKIGYFTEGQIKNKENIFE